MEDPRDIARRNARVEPGPAAKAARDRWIAAQGGEDAIRRRIAAGTSHSDAYLDVLMAMWELATQNMSRHYLAKAAEGARVARLRRARRRFRLALFLSALAVGAAAAVLVQIIALHWH